jgi:maltooligosyltrehalose trehalohydrolase
VDTAVLTNILGATVRAGETEFRVWSPSAAAITLRLTRRDQVARDIVMSRDADGTFAATAEAQPGDRYSYIVDGSQPVPDPVSRFLPDGVHGPTEIVDPAAFEWHDGTWRGRRLDDYILYELHAGTFTAEGTFEAIIARLDYLKNGLGVTAIEIMPVAQFPGERNWGYDGVSPYAVQNSYGGPLGLKKLVDAAHACGMAVVLDVVYNHLGNEGNYLRLFGPYFTDKHSTPWGEAVNYDQPGCEGVRRYVVENALYWIREYHLDGLRLDAVQTIKDDSPRHILAEIAQSVQQLGVELGRDVCVIAETDENDARITMPRTGSRPAAPGGLVSPAPEGRNVIAQAVRPGNSPIQARAPEGRQPSEAAYGLDAVWSDDFHHAIHAFFTGERQGYYQDFGDPLQIARALNEGFVFQGEPFKYWQGRSRGTSSAEMPPQAHVICIQNHDQVGNRAKGERLTALIPRGARFVASALLLLAPETPLLFMGQEWDEPAPFQFFTSYDDPELKKAVSEGRRREFAEFDWKEVPDPEDPDTFKHSGIDWEYGLRGNSAMLRWYRELIALRKRVYALDDPLASSSFRRGTASAVPSGPPFEPALAAGVRSCLATLLDGGGIRVQIPRENPQVLIVASLKAGTKFEGGGDWKELMCQDEDGYRVAVYQPTR